MKWPWNKPPENRGTLTFLADGRMVIGLPHDITERMADESIRAIRASVEGGAAAKTLVLPWPVDVVDKRPLADAARWRG